MNDALVGIDGINITLIGTNLKHLTENEKRNNNGNLMFQLSPTPKENEYNLGIVLPTFIRSSNLHGFGSNDCQYLENIKKYLQDFFGTDFLRHSIVREIEVNSNMSIGYKTDIYIVMDLIARTCLDEKYAQAEYCYGKRLYKTIMKRVIGGVEGKRHSCGRFTLKCYNKTKKSKQYINEHPVLRIELVYNRRGILQVLKEKKDEVIILEEILQEQSIQKFINRYIADVEKYVLHLINSYFDSAVDLLIKRFKKDRNVFTIFLQWQNYIIYDFSIFRTALYQYYESRGKTLKSAQAQIRRVKKNALKRDINIYEETFKEINQFICNIQSQRR